VQTAANADFQPLYRYNFETIEDTHYNGRLIEVEYGLQSVLASTTLNDRNATPYSFFGARCVEANEDGPTLSASNR